MWCRRSLPAGAVFFATLVLSNLSTALLVCVCVVCIVVDLVGWVWVLNPHSGSVTEGDYGVQINAVSVVNLVRRCPACHHVSRAPPLCLSRFLTTLLHLASALFTRSWLLGWQWSSAST